MGYLKFGFIVWNCCFLLIIIFFYFYYSLDLKLIYCKMLVFGMVLNINWFVEKYIIFFVGLFLYYCFWVVFGLED